MKKSLVIVAVIVGVILLGNVLIASAQDDAPGGWPMGPGMMMGRGSGMMMGGGPGGDHGWMAETMMASGGMHEQVWTAIAAELGLTYDDLVAALQAGQTVAELAEEAGVSLDAVRQAALEAKRAALAALVEQGVISQEQADWMLERMESMPMFNFGSGFGPGACHAGRPGGMMNGWQGGPGWPAPSGNNG
jgi:hypothetical protein